MRNSLIAAMAMMVLSSSLFATTLAEMGGKQAELEAAEMDAKIAKARNDGKPSSPLGAVTGPVVVSQTAVLNSTKKDSDLALNGIFGLGDKLKADISINGASVILSKGEAAMGWTVLDISVHEVVVERSGAKGKKTNRQTLRMMGSHVPKLLPWDAPGSPAGMQGMPPMNVPYPTGMVR
jgi:hypothetical protein